MLNLDRCTALITGASSGLGDEFARQLASRASHLILVARRRERLDHLKDVLEAMHPGLTVTVCATDLSDAREREALLGAMEEAEVVPDLLVNNAGLGDYGPFAEGGWERVEAMLDVNIVAVTRLAFALAPRMRAKGSGAIINVSSLAGFAPMPELAVYAASKAYVTSFSEALRLELKGAGVHVTALCPGPVRTEFGEVAERAAGGMKLSGGPLLRVEKARVVREALAGVEANVPRVTPGLIVWAAALLLGVLPMTVVRFLMEKRVHHPRQQA